MAHRGWPEMHSVAQPMEVCSPAPHHCNPGAVQTETAAVLMFPVKEEQPMMDGSGSSSDMLLPFLGRVCVLYPRSHGSSAGGLGSTPWLSHSGESL